MWGPLRIVMGPRGGQLRCQLSPPVSPVLRVQGGDSAKAFTPPLQPFSCPCLHRVQVQVQAQVPVFRAARILLEGADVFGQGTAPSRGTPGAGRDLTAMAIVPSTSRRGSQFGPHRLLVPNCLRLHPSSCCSGGDDCAPLFHLLFGPSCPP
eukprot:CAMPEP_0183302310 /NCGR_PEP_ID=MMETSP0160_2-20130417/8142_1 /TAXON_ID=2839 ORGANISM="Odontella Sinensis, Strain Grunow 1884" /NCGR_SAMPLE_ID=MMETSP0160_2 /ASSEMBLY_ACC=CAM_ASM_000250 /LENGTH=150 /DNA_ID=CAMNT_0025465063 /DNA_START=289 /DNA_END=737 /DNA_ORIENTATION=+